VIEQALYGTEGPTGYHFLARSPGFGDDWLAEAERLCTGFGERPAEITVADCVFALPFAARRVAVVQVADLGKDNTGRPGALGFRLLVLPLPLYQAIGGDPFQIAEAFPPPWQARGELPVLEWPGPFAPPQRTVEQIQKVLNVPYSATLLGGVQVLIDGGKLVFERTSPDPHMVRSLWALLPTSTRGELWPASFAFSNAHHFHLLVVPRASGPQFENYVHEEQAGDYPEGRYEAALQCAAENGKQDDLDSLFARRSRSQTLRLALLLLAVFLVIPLIGLALSPNPGPQQAKKPDSAPPKTQDTFRSLLKKLPCPSLDKHEREQLAEAIARIGAQYELQPPRNASPAALLVALEVLDARLARQEPRPPERRLPETEGQSALAIDALALPMSGNPLVTSLAVTFGPTGQLRDFGPLQRCIRVLLWKQAVPEASDLNLNTPELLERLEKKLNATKEGK